MSNENKELFFWHLKWIIFSFSFTAILFCILYLQTIYEFDCVTYVWERFFFPYLNDFWRNEFVNFWEYYIPIFLIPSTLSIPITTPTSFQPIEKFYYVLYGLVLISCMLIFAIPDLWMDYFLSEFREFALDNFNLVFLEWFDLFWDIFVPCYYLPLIVEE